MLWILLFAFLLIWIVRFGLALGGMSAIFLMIATGLIFVLQLKRPKT
jgi:hypothetical protein